MVKSSPTCGLLYLKEYLIREGFPRGKEGQIQG
jgi:hypothetical protein